MATLFSSLIVIIIINKTKSIGLCLSVFDWMCFNQTSNNCFDRINVRDTHPNTSRWFFWMLDRVVGNSSGHFKHDRRLSIISRSRFTSSVLNLRMNLVKHGKSCRKSGKNKLQIRFETIDEWIEVQIIHVFWGIGMNVANDFLANLRMCAGTQAHITKRIDCLFC